jgi:hypothetical protein
MFIDIKIYLDDEAAHFQNESLGLNIPVAKSIVNAYIDISRVTAIYHDNSDTTWIVCDGEHIPSPETREHIKGLAEAYWVLVDQMGECDD